MNIVTKFTVVTQQGMDALLMLTKEIAKEKYSSLVEKQVLDNYIATNFSEQPLVAAMNSISNQWLVVYADSEPAGYACITTNGKRPQGLEGKRAVRIKDFGVLHKYQFPAVNNSLLEKCLAVCKAYENVWLTEYVGNPLLGLFEEKGFVRQEGIGQSGELPLAWISLVALQSPA